MKWIKGALLDLAVTLLILVAVFTDAPWARWIIIAYTALLLALKVFSLLASGLMGQLQKPDEVPEWLYHVLYGLNVVVLLVARWWLPAAGWGLIWLLSFVLQRKMQAPLAVKGRRSARQKDARQAGKKAGKAGPTTRQ